MKLFSGSNSQALAKSIASKLNIPLADVEYVRFGDSETKPVIKEEVRGEIVVVIASTSNPVNESYMEFFLLCDALKRSAVEKIVAVMPYYGYARQNQQHLPGEPVSAHVMAKFIQSVGVDELITIDLHEEQVAGFFDIPVTHVSALPLLAKKCSDAIDGIKNQDAMNRITTQIVIVSPDQGGVERTRKFRDALAKHMEHVDQETAIVEKRRDLTKTHSVEVMEISGDVSSKIAIIPDDVIVSGGTIVQAAVAIKERGATTVYLAATHADFIEGTVEKLQNAPVEKVFVTDTIEIPQKHRFPKLQVLSVANLLADEIKKFL